MLQTNLHKRQHSTSNPGESIGGGTHSLEFTGKFHKCFVQDAQALGFTWTLSTQLSESLNWSRYDVREASTKALSKHEK